MSVSCLYNPTKTPSNAIIGHIPTVRHTQRPITVVQATLSFNHRGV